MTNEQYEIIKNLNFEDEEVMGVFDNWLEAKNMCDKYQEESKGYEFYAVYIKDDEGIYHDK